MKFKHIVASCLLFAGAALAQAGEAEVRKAWEASFKAPPDNVAKAGYLGLYEVFFQGEMFYTDEKMTAIIHGELIDGKTRRSVSREHLQKLTAIKFSDLPLQNAVKQVRGDGKRVFATFEDPNCGYCKRLAKDLVKLEDATIYTFLYPILGPDSKDKSERIWCAPDRGKAWNDWMIQGKEPQSAPASCDTSALEKNVALGRRLGVTGTPTLFFVSGDRAPGAIPIAEIEQRLNRN